jgi:hypothetical protein
MTSPDHSPERGHPAAPTAASITRATDDRAEPGRAEPATESSGRPAPEAQGSWRATVGSIAADVLPPLAVFYLLRAFGVPAVLAYTAGVIVPAARLVVDRLRGRPFNAVSGLVGVFLVVSVALAAFTGDVRVAMARGGIVYLAVAIAFAVSLLARRPLMLLIMRYYAERARPGAGAVLDDRYARAVGFRRATRVVTGVWAAGFVVTAVACITLAFALPISAAAAATSLVEPAAALALAGWTVRYLRPRLQAPATQPA